MNENISEMFSHPKYIFVIMFCPAFEIQEPVSLYNDQGSLQ